ncbi:lipase family protein [Nocardia sp. NPDC051570]|uniref:lipase family protein n=1 Tax=Nocardia sp. NPDC051570 TaxID=3364324 RepID=UPI00378B16E7
MNLSSFRLERRLFTVATVAAVTLAGPATIAAAEPTPVADADSFYTAPTNLAELPNGAFLRSREINPTGLFLTMPVKAWQVQYKTLDSNDVPTTGVATILVPPTPWTGQGTRPLVSHQVAEDSLGPHCATSRNVVADPLAGVTTAQPESALDIAALQQNWAVVLSDYEGPQERFLDQKLWAHSVLDGIRTARAFAPAELTRSPVALIGYSGGSMASIWAADEQPAYAPELPLAGMSVGGIPADIGAAFRAVNGTYSAGLGMLGLESMDRLHPEADIPALLNDRGKQAFTEDANLCDDDFLAKYPFHDLDDYTVAPNITDDPRLTAIADTLRLDRQTPPLPTFAWHSTADDVLPYASTAALVRTWCAAGAQITFLTTNTPTHIPAAFPGIAPSIDYLSQRFAGTPAPAGCT